jgi:nucleotide-binding universal stress UspA family protein
MHTQDARQILIAYDSSESARAAVREAAHLFRHRSVLVLTVWEPGLAALALSPPEFPGEAPTVPPELVEEMDRAMLDHASAVAHEGAELARSLGLASESMVIPEEMDVPEAIAKVAHDRDVQAVVTGTRGLSGLKSRILGSTSHGVIQHCRKPVLVVHADGDAHESRRSD